ncbi:MAG: DUF3795 domain-containing protein [Candidatus Eisenbacteria bacterium]|nr:DUF3795 domain-containing protein [Candidatus Eisenbacteria bacterium]
MKDQIGYCGIWCGSCAVGNGTLRVLSEEYGNIVKSYGLGEWGPADVDWKEFFRCLGSGAAASACPGCQKGGGRDNCEMRTCATGKGLEECVACGEQAKCKHSGILEHMRTGATRVGIFVKTDDTDRRSLIEEWTGKLRKQWPCSVLFAPTAPPTTPNGDQH